MPSVAGILRSFVPARFRIRRMPSVREVTKSVPFVQPLSPVGLKDFLALEIPPRAMLLNPILPERSLSMLYAPRGLGKSWLGLSIGLAVASGGSFLRWSAPMPRRVLYVDGEMQLTDLQARPASIQAGLGVEFSNDGFQMLAADNTESGINVGTGEGQQALERLLGGVDLLILDNLSTLMATGSEGASDAWLPVQNWLLRLRRKGIAVLIVHHAGKNGRQRGTSRREDALHAVIALQRPDDYVPEQGARFEVRFEKLRHRVGEGAMPFEAAVEPFVAESGGPGVRWVARDLNPPTYIEAANFYVNGKTVRQVAQALGISRSEAGRLRQKAKAEGLLDEGRDDDDEDPDPEATVEGNPTLN
jgi:putative DNA primase/helicase